MPDFNLDWNDPATRKKLLLAGGAVIAGLAVFVLAGRPKQETTSPIPVSDASGQLTSDTTGSTPDTTTEDSLAALQKQIEDELGTALQDVYSAMQQQADATQQGLNQLAGDMAYAMQQGLPVQDVGSGNPNFVLPVGDDTLAPKTVGRTLAEFFSGYKKVLAGIQQGAEQYPPVNLEGMQRLATQRLGAAPGANQTQPSPTHPTTSHLKFFMGRRIESRAIKPPALPHYGLGARLSKSAPAPVFQSGTGFSAPISTPAYQQTYVSGHSTTPPPKTYVSSSGLSATVSKPAPKPYVSGTKLTAYAG